MAAVFVGRRDELAHLVSCLDALDQGRGSLCAVIGEPGIGKTRLAEELAAVAEQRGAQVVWGAAWDGGGAPAYWPWIQVVRALRPGLPEPDERLRRDLGPLWDQAEPDAAPGSDVDLARFRRFDALRAVLHSAAAHRPLVVILDDVHAADRATLHALELIARSLRSLRVLLVATHRDAEARLDPELGELLARIARCGAALRLSRLSRPDVDAMLAGLDPLPARVVDQMYQTSGGNPLFLGETIHLVRTGARPDDVPDSVRAIIRDRLARLDDAARGAVEAAAVLGREMSARTLERTLAGTAATFERGVKRLCLAGVLVERGKDRLAFAHALFRECVYQDQVAERRRELHRRCGNALAAIPDATAEEVARHLVAALPDGDPAAALAWATRAGHGAARALAFDRAVEMFDGALAAARRLEPDTGRDIDIELQLAEALAHAGDAARAAAICVRAADLARAAGDGARLARSALALGARLRIGHVDPRLIGLLEEALAMVGEGELSLRARLLARLAAAQQPAPDPEQPMATARAAIELARATGDGDVLMQTLFSAGAALVDYAEPAERVTLAEELVALAIPRGQLVLAQQGYARLAIDRLELSDIAGADAAIAAHRRLGDALGHPRWQWRSHGLLAMRAIMDERFDDAERERAQASALAAQAEDETGALTLAVQHLGLLLARGAAPAELDSCEMAPLAQIDYLRDALDIARCIAAARGGDVEPGRQLLARLNLGRWMYTLDPLGCSLIAELVAAVGDVAAARRLLAMFDWHEREIWTWGVFGLFWAGPRSRYRDALLAILGRDPAAAAVRASPASAPPPDLRRDGDVWTLASGGREVLLKHSRAVDMLDQLLREPGREFHVFDLGAARGGEPIDPGQGGPALDDAAKQSYRRRLRELDEELARAEAWADTGRGDRARAEREFLEAELSAAVGLGGRDRPAAAAVERARVNVQKRLRGLIRKIAETLPDLARELESDIKTGTYVSYRRVT